MPSWLNEHHIKGAHAIKESSSLTKKRFLKNLFWQACMMPFKCLYPLPKDNRLTMEMIMQSINASVQCEIKKRGAYLRACWPYPVSPSSSTWSASPPDSASLQECCSPLRGNRVEAGDEGLVLAHAISLWPDDLVQLLHCSVGHHFLEKRKGEKGIYWIFQNLIRPRPQLPALHLWDSAPDLRGLEYQMLLWPMLEAAVALVHTLKSKFSVKVALASTLMGTQERGSYIKVDK